MAIPGNYKTVPNSLIGGNVVAILARQAIKLRALAGRLAFEAKKSALAGEDRQNPVVYVAAVPVSVRSQEVFTYSADVTEHAMESGVVFADHLIVKPLQVEIAFGVSNLVPGEAATALDQLEEMFLKREPVVLATTHKQLEDMVMTDLQADNTLPAWGALNFRATFRQVRFVALQAVKYPPVLVEDVARGRNPSSGPDVGKSAVAPTDKGPVRLKTPSTLLQGFQIFAPNVFPPR